MAVTTSLVPRPRIVAVLPHPAAATDEMKNKQRQDQAEGKPGQREGEVAITSIVREGLACGCVDLSHWTHHHSQ